MEDETRGRCVLMCIVALHCCCLAVTLVTTTIITLIAPRSWHHDKDVDILTYKRQEP